MLQADEESMRHPDLAIEMTSSSKNPTSTLTSPPNHQSQSTTMPLLNGGGLPHDRASDSISLLQDHGHDHDELTHLHEDHDEKRKVNSSQKIEESDTTISRLSTNKMAGQAVAPFLARHIPTQYAPLGAVIEPSEQSEALSPKKDPNSKFCYRHRPDLLCRKMADEPSMDNLQRDLDTLPSGDRQGIAHVWSLFSAAPSKHRNLMLQGILTQCCFSQLSYLSSAVRELIRIDFITALPAEVSFKILCYLDTTSLCKAAQVSQRWRILADDDVVWQKMCEQHIDRKCTKCGWGLPLLERKRLRDWKRQQQLRATGRGLNEWSPDLTPVPDSSQESANNSLMSTKRSASDFALSPETKRQCPPNRTGSESYFTRPKFRPWKDVYKDRFKIGTNWKYGRYTTKIFKGHTNGVMCLQFDDSILATGSYDSTIKIWDIETGEELRTLRGHTSGIRCLQFDDNKLISGSLDKTIKIWNWRTGECLRTQQGHTGGVISVHFEPNTNLIASGSIDGTVKIWDYEHKSTFTLRGHTDWVNAVKIDNASRTVLSASDDCTVRLWDLDTRTTIKTLEGHVGQVQQVLPLPSDYEPEDIDTTSSLDEGVRESSPESAMTTGSTATNGSNSTPPPSSNPNIPPSPSDLRDSFGPAFAPSSTRTSTSSTTTKGPPTLRPLPARYILTSSLDSTVRLWDLHALPAPTCLKTFFGHVEGVWALAADTLRVVSGGQDRMVKVWDARTGRCERTFAGHSGPVTCVGLGDSRMGSGGEDGEVRVWEFGVGREGD